MQVAGPRGPLAQSTPSPRISIVRLDAEHKQQTLIRHGDGLVRQLSHISHRLAAPSSPTPEKLCQGLNDITIIISGLMSCNIGCGTVIAGFTGNGDRKVSYRCIHWRLDQAQITIQSRAFRGK